MIDIPTRCVDSIFKDCASCPWGWIRYPDGVDSYEDTLGCCFDSGCTLGYDKGRLEDLPTKEELKAFQDWCQNH